MLKIIHRINSIKELKKISSSYWVEVDLRAYGNEIVLSHEAFETWDLFEEYLNYYKHKLIILNIKESGIENRVVELMEKFNINNYFLLDCEFPYIYRASRENNRKIAIRYSEDEPIEQAFLYKDKVDYLFIDTNTKLPIDKDVINQIKWFKICLVSPDRWGRPEDIVKYKKQIQNLGFELDMVMVWKEHINLWN